MPWLACNATGAAAVPTSCRPDYAGAVGPQITGHHRVQPGRDASQASPQALQAKPLGLRLTPGNSTGLTSGLKSSTFAQWGKAGEELDTCCMRQSAVPRSPACVASQASALCNAAILQSGLAPQQPFQTCDLAPNRVSLIFRSLSRTRRAECKSAASTVARWQGLHQCHCLPRG